MAKLGALFKDLAKAAGLNPDDQKYSQIVDSSVEVDDVTANLMRSNLMNMERAKNDPTLKKYYHAQALNAVDAELRSVIDEYGFDQDDVDRFESEKSTYKRLGMVQRRIVELEREKGGGQGDEGRLRDAIKELESKLKQQKAEYDSEREGYNAKIERVSKDAEASILDYAINAELKSRQYANDKLDPDVNVTVSRVLIEKKLAELGAMIARGDSGGLRLVHKDNPDQSFMPQNEEVEFGSFVDKILADNNMLKVTTAGANSGGGNNGSGRVIEDGGGASGLPESVMDFYKDQIAAYSNN